MLRLGRQSVRHYKVLFIGWFTTIVLGAMLIATCCMVMWATFGVGHAVGLPAHVTDTSTKTTHIYYQGSADLGGLISILIFGAVISGFLSVMVAAGTFSFAIALRRRDLALLRLLGASKKHIKRLVRSEALLVGLPATLVGCFLAFCVSPFIIRALSSTPLASSPLKTDIALLWPCVITFGVMLVIALIASRAAVQRAASVHPAEAFREANLESHIMTRARRWWVGILSVSGLLMTIGAPIFGGLAGPGAAIPLAIFGPLSLTIAAVLLGPVYLPTLVRFITKRVRGLPDRLAVASVIAARRRSAALTSPVIALLAAVGIMSCILQTTGATSIAEQRARMLAPLIVTSSSSEGLDDATLAHLRTVPQTAAVSTTRPVAAVVAGSFGSAPGETTVVYTDLPSLLQTQKIGITGDPHTPKGDNVAISSDFASWQGLKVGSSMQIGFFDKTTRDVKVTAILDAGPSMPPTVFTSPELARGHDAPAQEALLVPEPGTNASQLQARLQAMGLAVQPTDRWISDQQQKQGSLNMLVLLILALPGSAFTLVAIANTVIMGFKTRDHELATLRLLGASQKQTSRMVLIESLVTTAVGVVVATTLVALALLSYFISLLGSYLAVAISVPWLAYLLLVGLITGVGLFANKVALRVMYRLNARRQKPPMARV